MKRIDDEPKPFVRTPGTVSEETLKALMVNAKVLGWHSISEEALQRVFIPQLDTAKSILWEYAKDGQRAIREALMELELRPSHIRIGGFDEKKRKEMQRAILQFELNKMRLSRGEKLPDQPVSMYTNYRERFVALRAGQNPEPELLPIFHQFSIFALAGSLEKPDFGFSDSEALEILKGQNPVFRGTVIDQIEILRDNLKVFSKLTNAQRKLLYVNGIYTIASGRP